MKRTLLILASAIVVLLVIAVMAKKRGWISRGDVIRVSAESATRHSILEIVTASGKVQPEVEVKISPDVSGEIVELHVVEGGRVKAGDLLVKIKPDVYLATVEKLTAVLNSAHAGVATSRARLIETEATWKRNEQLWKQGVISDANYESSKTAYEVAAQNVVAEEYNVKSAEASLKEARNNLEKTIIYAPVNGTVYSLQVEKGERVVGTTQMAGTEMMRISDLNEMEVSVEVNENDIMRVNTGDTAEIEVDAFLGRHFKGVVSEVANSANVTGMDADQVTNFEVKIRILQESYADLILPSQPHLSPFRPGMSATVEIRTERTENVIAVPIQAVTTREPKEDGGEMECVFVVANDTARLVKVKTGIQDMKFIEVKEGLKGEQKVITAPYSAISKRLEDGKKVKVVDKKELFEEKETVGNDR